MNSDASVVRALEGRATPKVKPPWVCGDPLGRPQVLKTMPVPASVMVTGALFWPRADGRTATAAAKAPRRREEHLMLVDSRGGTSTLAAHEQQAKMAPLLLFLIGLAANPFQDQLRQTSGPGGGGRRRARCEQKCPLGGTGGNPVRDCGLVQL